MACDELTAKIHLKRVAVLFRICSSYIDYVRNLISFFLFDHAEFY